MTEAQIAELILLDMQCLTCTKGAKYEAPVAKQGGKEMLWCKHHLNIFSLHRSLCENYEMCEKDEAVSVR